MAKNVDILLRISAELFYRSDRIKMYMKSIGPGQTNENKQIVESIQKILEDFEQVAKESISFVKSSVLNGDKHIYEQAIQQLYEDLGVFSKTFIGIHESLVYLPRRSVPIEAMYTIRQSFGSTFVKDYDPSIILGSIFNALEFDFLEILKNKLAPNLKGIIQFDDSTKNIILQLPICDCDCPLSWSVLAHEMGHAIDFENSISKSIVDEIVTSPEGPEYKIISNWTCELCADLIAAHAFGPSVMLSLVSMEYCVHTWGGIWMPSESHPATKWRFKTVYNFLLNRYRNIEALEILDAELSIYLKAWQDNFETHFPNEDDRNSYLEWEDDQLKKVIEPIAKLLQDKINNLGIKGHDINHQGIERCIKRLKAKTPIAAQGLSRDVLRKEISKFELEKSTVGEVERIDKFKEMVAKFAETPMEMPTVMLSGFGARKIIINDFVNCSSSEVSDKIKQMNKELSELDKVIVESVRGSTISMEELNRKNSNELHEETFA